MAAKLSSAAPATPTYMYSWPVPDRRVWYGMAIIYHSADQTLPLISIFLARHDLIALIGSKGISCFLIEKGTPGLSFGKKEKKVCTGNIVCLGCAVVCGD